MQILKLFPKKTRYFLTNDIYLQYLKVLALLEQGFAGSIKE